MREEQLKEYPQIAKFYKYVEAQWPGLENLAEYSWVDEQGNVHIRTTDDDQVAQLILSKNGFQVTVNYLHLLPIKKPCWVQVEDKGSSR